MRIEAETELQRSQAASSALIENANDAIWSIDRSYRVTAFNSVAARRFAAMFGGRLRAGTRRRRADAGARPGAVAGALRPRPGRRALQHRALDRDPRRHRATSSTSFNPIVTDGMVTGLAIFSADVTERKRAEEAARQHQAELTHVLRLSTMGEMAAGLAHEINQPLAAIVNYAQGCGRRLRAQPGRGRRRAAGDRRHRRRGAARRRDHPPLAQPGAQGGAAAGLDRPQRGGRRGRAAARSRRPASTASTVRSTPSRELPPVRRRPHPDRAGGAQPAAQRHRRDGRGRRAPRAARAHRARSATRRSSWRCATPGTGMPPLVAERVFDPFFSTKPGGLGMGLSISRTIIEAHQGRLSVTPQPRRRRHLPRSPAGRAPRCRASRWPPG